MPRWSLRTPLRWLRRQPLFPRKLKLTREGKYLVLLSLGVGFGAINTGNNLLYLVFGLMLSLIVVSGILSEVTLRRITVELQLPSQIHARTPALARVEVRNGKRRFSSFSVEVELYTKAPGLAQRPAYVLHLRAGASEEAHLELRFEARGAVEIDGLRIATRFPFGFFRKSRVQPLAQALVVYPALVDVDAPALPPREQGTTALRPRAGRGEDFYALREQRPGDDVRDVYWKVSAKLGMLVVREYEEPVRRQVTVCFPNVLADRRSETRADVEEALAAAATLVIRYAQQGARVGVATADANIPPGEGVSHVRRLLLHLALLELRPPPRTAVRLEAGGGPTVLVRHVTQRVLRLRGGFGLLAEIGAGGGGRS